MRHLKFSDLPEDMLRAIAEYCDWPTRLELTCTHADLMPLFLGSIRLSQEASERFLTVAAFRKRVLLRVAMRPSQIHLRVGSNDFTEAEIEIMNSVRSVTLIEARGRQLDAGWLSGVRLIKTLTGLDLTGTKILDVSALAILTNLTHLYLSFTQVSDISALAGLSNLTHLNVDNTPVSDVSALASRT